MKITMNDNGWITVHSEFPDIWFYDDEDILNVPSPVIKSPDQARSFAKVLNFAAQE